MAADIPAFPKIETPPSLKEMAFGTIKSSILNHNLQPGGVYSEQAIAKELGISKTPVHNALVDLEARGFVKLFPRKGFQVNALKEKDVEDMFEYRHALECAVILHVTPELTDEEIADLESMTAQAAATRDRILFLKFDRGFHRYLTEKTENTYIINALEHIWDLCDWVGGEIFHLGNRPEEAVAEHMAVIEKLKARDVDRAKEAMREHLEITELRFHQLIDLKESSH
ncbi:MAG: GntR family transcriptional regulator [Deltaproteobacteria bacterium]|nr:GntR family transcriptional regulator [Deltaproteobacteria bacterium]MBW1817341.1 GntR family transcriptional regulator [Deltaproteobacteria bacterium]